MATESLSTQLHTTSFPSLQEVNLFARTMKKIKSNSFSPPNGECPEINMTKSQGPAKMATQIEEESPTRVELDILDTPPSLSFANLLHKEDNDPIVIEFSAQPNYLDEDSDIEEASEENILAILLPKADKKRI
ncbi:hypothetical protein SLEP1_g3071 [Rubroshorea leprosula]|uniref:Uncharacterized protein n=1 Tax=Rubroshorea leprosula TaxID=152421 RepID=A0AAV5HV12_9ROSI|nr:hypothetical protein SLEP1_g3071 [Rubroshorea leprosula]